MAPSRSPGPCRVRARGYAASAARAQDPDAIEAAFRHESYAPGAFAALRVHTAVSNARLRVYRVGPEKIQTTEDNEMFGVPVTPTRVLRRLRAGATLRLHVGRWPSGLYFAKLTSPGRVGYAPFVVRPAGFGDHRVAIVMPTRTWQSYNFRDDDRDGRADTWYTWDGRTQARLVRPFLNRGVPPFFRRYDLRFIHWLDRGGKAVDVLAQADLDHASGDELAAAYDAIVFPGHHEYVTKGEYDAIEGYRNRGGNLAFLSANNFFWRVDVRGETMTRVEKWRDLGRPEAALVGVQYNGNDRGERRAPYLVRKTRAAEWLFASVELKNGNEFSYGSIEIDSLAPSSPRGIEVVAEIPNLLGPGRTAHMTYYETRRGARVFAAGAFTLAGNAYERTVQVLLENLWIRLTEEEL